VPPPGVAVALEQVEAVLGNATILDGIDLAVSEGEFLSLLGPSGAGKSTILNVIAGFVPVQAGRVLIEGRDATYEPAHRRNIGFIFQEYALFPHLSVEQNVRFPLDMRGIGRKAAKVRVQEQLEIVGLGSFANRRPHALSGGQRQRVAIARALVFQPRILLMDEPLSSLDRHLREEMTSEIRRIQRDVGVSVVYVTHDQAEALSLSDRIGILNAGQIEQLGDPATIHEHPVSPYAARLSGPINVASAADVRSDGETVRFSFAGTALVAPPPEGAVSAADAVAFGVRPYHLHLGRSSDPGNNTITARVGGQSITGSGVQYELELASGDAWTAFATSAFPDVAVGDEVDVSWAVERTILMRS
jgi:putative spermidine/putrescine transport system ATP-binding protein